MVSFLQLLGRPIERFFAQWLLISSQPSVFVRERVRLGDTTNFIRAGYFFLSAIAAAFMAEVATLYLLDIGDLTEPYYWLVILLTSIPFVLICFLLVRLVAPLSFKDVLHLSLYPIGAGVFAGAAFALVSSAVVGLLIAVGFISDIKIDYTQWAETEDLRAAIFGGVLRDCLKQESLIYTILAAGLGEAYSELKPPIDDLSYIRPIITLLYLVIVARFLMIAVDRRKGAVFGLVILAALVTAAVDWFGLREIIRWTEKNSSCEEDTLVAAGLYHTGESALKDLARKLQAAANTVAKDDAPYDVSVRAEGRTLMYTFHLKKPIFDMAGFNRYVNKRQKELFDDRCSDDNKFMIHVKAIETHTYYSAEGERLTSFSIDRSGCPQW